ncbi:NAD(P)/FAD-dependent oxidoreductase [Porphyromonas sp. COT-290 OH860]|uniref:NAD(P)/FAD-dependent oxidoreductase n=1 Tax=Porphyromonas sp. COT-290 OH860 TaxID=1515615 RepID=UPI00052E37BA|nr:FAD-dependent monooxygenase [Porphyromonas sp. COT-290 OH860]KGN86078.1 FAD-binding protein [Porphyromonas sp. COT-290 OH860]
MQQLQLRLSPEKAASDATIRAQAAKLLRCGIDEISSVQIRRHTIDARQRHIVINLTIDVYMQGEKPQIDDFSDIVYPDVSSRPAVVVVGAGPCGLFAALRLIELGLRPLIVERGQEVMKRRRDLSLLHKTGEIDPESNYSFGEGGAGAFSDGKLYTRSKKRGSVEKILRVFCKFGADPKILVDAHPHIGTDKLPKIIKQMREQIITSGGEVHFGCRMDELIVEGGRTRGIVTSTGQAFWGPVILATGHSARDLYRYLHRTGIFLEAKPIAVGVRLEHPQELIDQIRYHNRQGRGKYLPAAEYVYKTRVRERGVYSFCMCPGGFVVPAATAPEETVVNGMSPANRGSKWANSGMVVELRPEDMIHTGVEISDKTTPLALMEWCERFEHLSYLAANRSLRAPAQRLTDFLNARLSSSLPSTSYNMGLTSSNMHDWMPRFITHRLAEGFKAFDRMTKGFISEEAQLIGVESRTSSPVRIPRLYEGDRAYQHLDLEGLYPAGEGAGYAGGIVSAAIDGENAAQALAFQVKFNV